MRLAINWFRISLPSSSLEIPAERLPLAAEPRLVRYQHRTLSRQDNDRLIIYHFTETPPPSTTPHYVAAKDDPSLINLLIEDGFSQSLRAKHFRVRTGYVGAEGHCPTGRSIIPELYEFLKGISYRAFMIWGHTSPEWGLILNFSTTQRFIVSLEDHYIRERALGERVIAIGEGIRMDDQRKPVFSGILCQADSQKGVISVGKNRTQLTIDLGQWTLPCRRDTLLALTRDRYGEQRALTVSRQLQQDSFVTASNGRMNSTLAKDQLDEVGRIIRKHGLSTFTLPIPSRPPVMLSATPMILEH